MAPTPRRVNFVKIIFNHHSNLNPMGTKIIETVLKLLGNILDNFKLKNPAIFAIISVTGLIGVGVLDNLQTATVDGGDFLVNETIRQGIASVKWGILVFLTALGVHTPKPGSLPKTSAKE